MLVVTTNVVEGKKLLAT